MREQAEWALSYLARNGLHLRFGLKKLGYSGDSSTIPEDATLEVTCKIKSAKDGPVVGSTEVTNQTEYDVNT